MLDDIENKLKLMGIELPNINPPVANYVSYVKTGNLVFISGQVCKWNGQLKYAGKLGKDFSITQGQDAAKICALNLIAQAKQACNGDLGKIKRLVKLNVFVNSTEDFVEQPQVANGASDLMVEIFGEKGEHSRAAVSCPALPSNTAVEIDAVFEIEEQQARPAE